MRNIDPDTPVVGAFAAPGLSRGPSLTARAGVAAFGVGLPLLAIALAVGDRAPLAAVAVLALYAAIAGIAVARIAAFHPFPIVGLPNLVTLVRAGLVCLLAAPVLEPALFDAGSGFGVALVLAVALVALALDGVDGWAARRLHLSSRFGARFDMEVDALFVLLLAALAARAGEAGPWVLALGLIRYGFLAASIAVPAMTRPLPPSFRRKAVCVLQVVALIAVLLPFAGAWIAALALAALVWSFAVDTLWLLRPATPTR